MMRAASLLNDLSTLENEIRAKNVYIEQAELTHTGLTKELRKGKTRLHAVLFVVRCTRIRIYNLVQPYFFLSPLLSSFSIFTVFLSSNRSESIDPSSSNIEICTLLKRFSLSFFSLFPLVAFALRPLSNESNQTVWRHCPLPS